MCKLNPLTVFAAVRSLILSIGASLAHDAMDCCGCLCFLSLFLASAYLPLFTLQSLLAETWTSSLPTSLHLGILCMRWYPAFSVALSAMCEALDCSGCFPPSLSVRIP